MDLARSPKPGNESRRNHIVSAIEDRNELCTDCVIRNGYSRQPMSNCIHSHAHPSTLMHARLLDIRWTPTARIFLVD